MDIEDPIREQHDMTTQTLDNPQEEPLPQMKATPMSEPEITYQLSLFK